MEGRTKEEKEAELLRPMLPEDARAAAQHEEEVPPPMQEEQQSAQAQESVQHESLSSVSVWHEPMPEVSLSRRNRHNLCAHLFYAWWVCLLRLWPWFNAVPFMDQLL